MKQGILITAYKNVNHLKDIIDSFDDDFLFYIHIDKKSKISKAEIDLISKDDKVCFVQKKYKINWNSINHIEAILLLIKEALRNTQIEYLHLISGLDFPIKSCSYIKEFVIENKGKQFLEYSELPSSNWDDFEWSEGGLGRLSYYYLYDLLDVKRKGRTRLNLYFVRLQWKLGLKRKLHIGFPKLYGGSSWWTLSRECVAHVYQYAKNNPHYLERFKFTFGSDEIFVHSIIMNSSFRNDVVNDNLRYIVWENRNGNNPANLDERDYENITKSHKLFARKFDGVVSNGLISKLKKDITTTTD